MPASAPDHIVPFVPRATNDVREGFVRVINHGDEGGEVRIDAYDDDGVHRGPVTLTVPAEGAVHFNSDDLAGGNADKGLAGRIGSGIGDWRLEMRSDLDVEVLAYIRTADGFVTTMHDTVPVENGRHRVVFFNPASNVNQVSMLRLINRGAEDIDVAITARDDGGRGATTELSLAAGWSRTLTAVELESGTSGLSTAIGDGSGKWRLSLDASGPLIAVSLLASPTGHLANLSSIPRGALAHSVSLFPAKRADGRQGFARIINRDPFRGTVTIYAYDDSGSRRGPLTLTLPGNGAAHFNSDDLQDGNTAKGLVSSAGWGIGDWRLVLRSELEIEALAYVRTADGFVTTIHDTALVEEDQRWVPFFNPGGNVDQVSSLRLTNANTSPATATIRGVDDGGARGGPVTLTIPPRGARTVTALELETGTDVDPVPVSVGAATRTQVRAFAAHQGNVNGRVFARRSDATGTLGDGSGKWRLEVLTEGSVIAMSLLESPTGHLTNLSSAGRSASTAGSSSENGRSGSDSSDTGTASPVTVRTAATAAAAAVAAAGVDPGDPGRRGRFRRRG